MQCNVNTILSHLVLHCVTSEEASELRQSFDWCPFGFRAVCVLRSRGSDKLELHALELGPGFEAVVRSSDKQAHRRDDSMDELLVLLDKLL